jgi:alkylation response protein AidB-like acyl-CoA dehydrogenase
MDFELTSEQKMLADSAASFAKKTSPVERLRKLREIPRVEGVEQRHGAKTTDPRNWEPAVWKQMAELGWLGLFYPESVGGLGLRFFDASLVIEKLATTLVPEPYVASVVLGGWPILKAGSPEQHKRFLEPMIEGKTSHALAWQEPETRYDVTKVATTAKKTSSGWTLSGDKAFVLNGHAADQLVVSASADGALALFVIDAASPGVEIQPFMTMDSGRAATVRLRDAAVTEDRRLAAGDARAALEHTMDLGAAAACAEGLGIARTVLEMTVSYLKVRKQFGVPIGSFQALQHRCVDMFVQTQLLESTAILAAVRADEDDRDERERAVSIAKARLSVGGKMVTQQSIQLHGGIGLTDEHDIGLYFKRMQVLTSLFGDEDHHVARFSARKEWPTSVGD